MKIPPSSSGDGVRNCLRVRAPCSLSSFVFLGDLRFGDDFCLREFERERVLLAFCVLALLEVTTRVLAGDGERLALGVVLLVFGDAMTNGETFNRVGLGPVIREGELESGGEGTTWLLTRVLLPSCVMWTQMTLT